MAANLEKVFGIDDASLRRLTPNSYTDAELQELQTKVERVSQNLRYAILEINKDIVGQPKMVRNTILGMLGGGHVLLEGAPGAGKTTLARSISTVFGLHSSVVAFRSDMMPSELIGYEKIEHLKDGNTKLAFVMGPVFTQYLLADEINRAPPRTQAALLQAMQEKFVTHDGQVKHLPRPFHVIATQNPIEQEGTFPLPEAQVDRFLIKQVVPYLKKQDEIDMWIKTTGLGGQKLLAQKVFTDEELMDAQLLVRAMPISDAVREAAYRVSSLTRPGNPEAPSYVKDYVLASSNASVDKIDPNAPQFLQEFLEDEQGVGGAGSRGGQALCMTIRAKALLEGRYAPSIDDVREMAIPTISHRFNVRRAAGKKIEITGMQVPVTPRSIVAKLACDL